jgi:hypothetical protein
MFLPVTTERIRLTINSSTNTSASKREISAKSAASPPKPRLKRQSLKLLKKILPISKLISKLRPKLRLKSNPIQLLTTLARKPNLCE